MAMPQRDDTIKKLKRSVKWSAEACGEGGCEVVPPEKEEAFRKMAEEENLGAVRTSSIQHLNT